MKDDDKSEIEGENKKRTGEQRAAARTAEKNVQAGPAGAENGSVKRLTYITCGKLHKSEDFIIEKYVGGGVSFSTKGTNQNKEAQDDRQRIKASEQKRTVGNAHRTDE